MDKATIARNFSKYAHLYDRYADVQRTAASELLGKIKGNGFQKILEIGCGTGNYTFLLKHRFKNALLKAIDISEKMVEIAKYKVKDRKIEFIVGDAEDIQLDESFDLVTSNSCFQWFNDLEKTLLKYKNLLNKSGIISFSLFGSLTFWELNAVLKYFFKEESIDAAKFITKEKIKDILYENFQETKVEEIKYEEPFLCLKDLFKKIKYSGIRGEGLDGKIFFSPSLLNKIEGIYRDKFGQIKATYQVFYCRGLKV